MGDIRTIKINLEIKMDILSFLNLNSGSIQAFSTIILVLITAFYALQTRKTVKEITRQTDLQQMPVIMLFIRDIRDYMDDITNFAEQQKYKRKYEGFFVRIRTETENSNYYLSFRNTGNGTAFNVELTSDLFAVSKYQTRFLAPSKDEQPFAIVQKENNKIESWDKLKDSVFEISCKDINGTVHFFKYKIVDFKNKEVDFIEYKKIN